MKERPEDDAHIATSASRVDNLLRELLDVTAIEAETMPTEPRLLR